MSKSNADAARQTFSLVLRQSESLLARMGLDYETAYRMCVHALIQSQIRARGRNSATIADCTPDSIKLACIKWLNAGLAPDGEHIALVPLRSGSGVELNAWVGIVGKLALARRATPGLAIESRAVYRDDEFRVEFGLEPILVHTPSETGGRDEAAVRAVYAIARMPGAAPEVEVWYRPDIDRYRAMSRAKGGPWSTGHYAEMAERGPLGALLKRLPKRAVDLVDPDTTPFGDAVEEEPVAVAPARPAAVEHKPEPVAMAPAPAREAAPEPNMPPADDNPPADAYESNVDDPFA